MSTRFFIKPFYLLLLLSFSACGPGVDFRSPVTALSEGTPSNSSPSNPDGQIVGIEGKETFFQANSNNTVDILMVIDNSKSMLTFQDRIAPGFSNLIGSLNGVNWQMAFTTTDKFDGSLYNLSNGAQILTAKTSNPASVFQSTLLSFGESGDADERGIKAAASIISSSNNATKSFFRNNASLAVVFLTDEDERSTGGVHIDHNGDGWTGSIENDDRVENLISLEQKILGKAKKFSAYSIIIQPGDTNCYNQDANGFYGSFYAKLTNQTGGVTGSICDADYSTTLKNISNDISQLLNSFTLTHSPRKNSLQITLTPRQPDVTHSVAGKTVTFSRPPNLGTQIDISYQYGPKDD
jgi:hypothetical protein